MSSSEDESVGDAREEMEEEDVQQSPRNDEDEEEDVGPQKSSRKRRQVDSDDSDDDAPPPAESSGKKAKKRTVVSDDEEDESEDEEEEEEESSGEEEEEAPRKKRAPKKRRRTVHDFIQDDVEVDDDEEDEDVDYADDDIMVDPAERRLAERAIREQEALSRQHPHSQRNRLANMTEEEMGRYFEAKHAQESYVGRTVNDEMFDSISQNSLLPTTKDPNLWIIKVREGQERAITLQLLRRCIAASNTDEPLNIASVICKDNLKGMLYVEARKKAYVERLIDGIQAINPYEVKMVPIDQMVDTLKVVKKVPNLKTDDYVRVTRSMYKNDLAQVDWVDVAQNQVCLRLLPRIDYKKKRGFMRDNQNDDEEYNDDELSSFKKAINRKSARSRPPAAPFDLDKIRELGADTSSDGDFVMCEGNRYRRGLLYKVFPLTSVTDENIHPTMEELKHFHDKPTTDPEFLKELAKTKIKDDLNVFVVGDVVEVAEGELMNLRGTVQSVEKDGIVMLPDHEDLKKPLKFNPAELRKFFKPGDHVRITGGKFEGMTGSVVSVEGNVVVVISDLNLDHMSVRLYDVRLDAQVSTGVDQLGQFQFHDLVSLDADNVGVIIRLEREYVEVLNTQGNVVRVKAISIQPRQMRMAKAFDAAGNTIQAGDRVKINDSLQRGFRDGDDERVGEIKYIYRNAVFAYSRKYTQNSGMFVCRNKQVTLLGASNAPMAAENPTASMMMNGLMSPRHAMGGGPAPMQTPSVHSSSFSQNGRMFGGGGGMRGGGNQGPRRDTSIIGKTVRIKQGPMKGELSEGKHGMSGQIQYSSFIYPLTSFIVQGTWEWRRTRPKRPSAWSSTPSRRFTISVDRSRVDIVGAPSSTSARPSAAPFGAGSRTPSAADRMGRTPLYGAGSQTPMYGAGAQTPMHDSFGGGRTPHYGAMTPAHTDGGRTPQYSNTWDPSNVAATPARSVMHEDEEDDEEEVEINKFGRTPHAYSEAGQSYMNAPTPSAGSHHDFSYGKSPYSRSGYESVNDSASFARPPAPRSTAPIAEASDSFLRKGEWVVADLLVRVLPTCEDEEIRGMEGSVRDAQNAIELYFEDLEFSAKGAERTVPRTDVEPVQPVEGDRARVIFGPDDGKVGKIEERESNMLIMRVDGSQDVKMNPAKNYCKTF
ncbi:Transcription elongation factor SPT5 [Aphelenchoides fujianensis]|nr:Transcription elongation factor SPT5 [Aphelenchoides fujianensis]